VGLSNRVPAEIKGGKVIVYGQAIDILGEAHPDGPVLAMIRPEDVSLDRTAAAGTFPATVAVSSFLGSFRRTQVRLADDTIVSVQHAASDRHEPGDSVNLRIDSRSVSVEPLP
jgi:putative spermidine/putrescine transport system ATP-binding protein